MNIQVYADKVNVEHESQSINVMVDGVDASLLLGQFSSQELLEHIDSIGDFASIVDYASNSEE